MELDERNIELFTHDATSYIRIEAQIAQVKEQMKPYQERLKKLTADKKELEQQLCETMGHNDLTVAKLPEDKGTLEYKVKESLVPLKKQTIKEKMAKFFEFGPGNTNEFERKNAQEKGLELFNYVYEDREKVRKESIKSKNSKA